MRVTIQNKKTKLFDIIMADSVEKEGPLVICKMRGVPDKAFCPDRNDFIVRAE